MRERGQFPARRPGTFSVIDDELHNPAYAWHLIISLRVPSVPALRPFAVRTDRTAAFGIGPDDHHEGSEHAHRGPEVTPLRLVVESAADDRTDRTVASCVHRSRDDARQGAG